MTSQIAKVVRTNQFYRSPEALMIQGTTSGAGKSTLVAGLCRALARRGYRVAPFKPQNMSLNSAVTRDGGEIARAQALQATAAGLAPRTDMNPVLLKPSSETRAQLVVNGRVRAELEAGEYQAVRPDLLPEVLAAYARLRAEFDTIIVEGAGSPAEVNLRAGDIANMGFAEAVDCRVAIVADIDRGGVFAHLVGTLSCLSASERSRVNGFVINRFRGERNLLAPGINWLEEQTAKPVFGVLPFINGLTLDAEDALPERPAARRERAFKVVVPVYPQISNHTDLDALRRNDALDLVWVGPAEDLPPADLIVLPGSKNVRADLQHLQRRRWDDAIRRHLRYGGKVLAICGGMQMLGRWIHDPCGVEGGHGSSAGLGLLDFETTLGKVKQLRNVSGLLFPRSDRAVPFDGYEIHMGVTRGPALARPALLVDGEPEGALSEDGRIFATYVHGVLDRREACNAVLRWAGELSDRAPDLASLRNSSLDRLADCVEESLDLEQLFPRMPIVR